MAEKPTTASRTATTTCAREGRSSAVRSRCRPVPGSGGDGSGRGDGSGDGSGGGGGFWGTGFTDMAFSGMEQVSADRRHVGEDADPEHDDDAGGELAADAELVAEVDDRRGDDDVAEEGDDEDLVVEDPVEVGAQAAEDGVERGDDGDRQVGLETERDVGLEHDAEHDPGQEPEGGDH